MISKVLALTRGGHVKNVHTRMRGGVGCLPAKKHKFYCTMYVTQILLCVFYAIALKCVIFPFLNPFGHYFRGLRSENLHKIGPGKCLKISRKKCEFEKNV